MCCVYHYKAVYAGLSLNNSFYLQFCKNLSSLVKVPRIILQTSDSNTNTFNTRLTNRLTLNGLGGMTNILYLSSTKMQG